MILIYIKLCDKKSKTKKKIEKNEIEQKIQQNIIKSKILYRLNIICGEIELKLNIT